MTKVRHWDNAWVRGKDAAKVHWYGPGRSKHAARRAARLRAAGYSVEIEQAPVGRFELVAEVDQ